MWIRQLNEKSSRRFGDTTFLGLQPYYCSYFSVNYAKISKQFVYRTPVDGCFLQMLYKTHNNGVICSEHCLKQVWTQRCLVLYFIILIANTGMYRTDETFTLKCLSDFRAPRITDDWKYSLKINKNSVFPYVISMHKQVKNEKLQSPVLQTTRSTWREMKYI